MATSCKHLVNFGLVTSEFKRVKDVHLSSINSLATFALLLDLAGISTEFSGAITTRFCFTYTLEGVTAMPRGLHDRLCHAFLVYVFRSILCDLNYFNVALCPTSFTSNPGDARHR